MARVAHAVFRGFINVVMMACFLAFIGEVPLPFFSIYNASKAAVKQFTESLSYELKDWGVKVSMVAPAAFKTGNLV